MSADPQQPAADAVRIRAHAFGGNQPPADLLLAPDDTVCANGAAFRARDLVNGTTVTGGGGSGESQPAGPLTWSAAQLRVMRRALDIQARHLGWPAPAEPPAFIAAMRAA